MKNRNLLIAAAAVVVALIAGLVWSLRSGDEKTATVTSTETEPARPPASEPTANTPRPPAATPQPRTEPARPVPLPPVETTGDAGVRVRDHRLEGRPAPPSPIAPTTIAEARQVMEPAVRACMRDLQLAVPARIVVHAKMRAAQSRVSTSEVSITGDGVLGAEVTACIVKAYQEFQTDMLPEQTDGEDYVHMPWTVP